MRVFGRRNPAEEQARAIATFWTWWNQTGTVLDQHARAGEMAALGELIGPAVAALHPDLVWEIAPGGTARHALVLSASGDPELRPLVHRWVRGAPSGGDLWEFHPGRQAHPRAMELTVKIAGRDFGLDALVLGLRVPPGAPRVDISAFHPIFPDIEDNARMDATLLALDWLLGEDEVARWVGDIVAAEFEPIDAIPAIHLPAVVADVAEGFTGDQWATLEGRTPTGRPVAATVRYPLRPVDYPCYDQHIGITLPYREADGDGLPTGDSATAVREFTDRLAVRLGELGTAVLVAQITADGTAVLYVYADSEGDAAKAVRELAGTWTEGRARVTVTADLSWSEVATFLT